MITWVINDICNFECSYCTVNNKKKRNLTPVNIQVLSESLMQIPNDWLFLVTGGEPFLEKNILEICQEITKRHFLALNTNLSTSNIFNFFDTIDNKRTLFINASIHIEERLRRDKDLNGFVEKVLYLQSKGFNIISTYVAHPLMFDRMEKDFAMLKSRGIEDIRVKIFRGIHDGKYYPPAFNDTDRMFLKNFNPDYPETKILDEQQHYHGLLCRAGQRFFTMDRTGNLKRCSAVSRNYGNFLNKSILYDKKIKPCPLNSCGCPYEGIRNVINTRGNSVDIIREDLIEMSHKVKKVIKNPSKIKKVLERLPVFASFRKI